jgi:hypothetical protein
MVIDHHIDMQKITQVGQQSSGNSLKLLRQDNLVNIGVKMILN